MERRRRQQRLKIDERQGRPACVHGHRRPARPRFHRGPDHLHDPLPRYRQRPPGRQVDPLHQHHGQARKGLRQQVSRIHEGGEGMGFTAHRQGDGAGAAPLVPPVDQVTNGADEGRQQAEAVDSRPQGHRAQEHPAGPGPGSAQGKEQQSPAQQQRRGEQGEKGPEILLAAHEQRRHQQAGRPSRQAQQLGPFP